MQGSMQIEMGRDFKRSEFLLSKNKNKLVFYMKNDRQLTI